MRKLILTVFLVLLAASAYANPFGVIQGGGGTTNASDLTSGTVAVARGGTGSGTAAAARAALGTDNAANIDGTKGGLDNVVIGATTPAAATVSSLTRGSVSDTEFSYLDGVTSAIQTQLDGKQATLTAIDNLVIGGTTAAAGTFTTVTAGEFVSSAADNTRGVTVPNTADPTGANLAAGKCWYNITANTWVCRNGDNTVTTVVGAQVKTFSFVIDNVVVATDNILLMKVPRAMTLTQADCYASTDNVVGSLMECASDNVTSCTVLDSWTVTNAVSPFTDSTMTDGAVASGAWLRWSTTSVGTTNSNKLSCTVRYRE